MAMEGPEYYPTLHIDPDGWKEDKFWSTTSFRSEIPLPYYSQSEYDIRNKPVVPFESAIRGGVFMARNCHSKNSRERVMLELQDLATERKTLQIDSVSTCVNNAHLPAGANDRNKTSIMDK
eukprot:CAMPEP_0172463548 /NCGR_PEP_ID=MMETSP1065-20121228/47586_1 /TAXON_ID=265537 /ORGANISM="Amphiprora paludosa, Strain CCMP125" /LENGTH=120 /DNA_ID=CAMNT_0013219531 /DNA_START=9 /DNA_END=368 /DNA_ORIENTATION=-